MLACYTSNDTMHRHHGLNFVRPAQRHMHEADAVMRQRVDDYKDARVSQLRRGSRKLRDWSPRDRVWLTPIKAAESEQAKAA